MRQYQRLAPVFLMCAAMLLLACGCAGQPEQKAQDGRLRVVTTIFPPYDFAREIAGERAEIQMLLPLGSESHSYEPTPQDIIAIQNCDVFLYVGGESDEWVSTLLETMDTSHMQIIAMMDCVEEPLEEEAVDGDGHMHGAHADGQEEHGEYDEHVWTNPLNAIQIVDKIAFACGQQDAAHAEEYRKAAERYEQQLLKLDEELEAIVAKGKRKTLVFADRFPMRYFVERYGLSYHAAFAGCASDTEAGAASIAHMIDVVSKEQIPVVLHMELSNEKIADTICEETGAVKRQFHSCHNVTREQFDAGVGYVDLMKQNADVLREALQAE